MMGGEDLRVWLRIRAVLARELTLPFDELDRKLDAGVLALEDVLELYTLAACQPFTGEALRLFLHREKEAKRDKDVGLIRQLAMEYRVAKKAGDEATMQRLKARIKELQGGGK